MLEQGVIRRSPSGVALTFAEGRAARGVCRTYGAGATLFRSLLACLICLLPLTAGADIAGKVVGIADGDTVTVLDGVNRQYKVRLAGIDAPEKSQPFGQRSKQSLSDCAFGRSATVEGSKLDRYGRVVGKVLVGGVDCNLRQVEHGLAWHYKRYAREQEPADRLRYDAAEAAAKRRHLGLWQDPDPIPPWDFRRSKSAHLEGLP